MLVHICTQIALQWTFLQRGVELCKGLGDPFPLGGQSSDSDLGKFG
jgi:hypothetical protein